MEKHAEIAYLGYAEALGWKNSRGENMVEWDKLSAKEQLCWQGAAFGVIDITLKDVTAAKIMVDSFVPPMTIL